MAIDWARAYNRLFEIINQQGAAYYSGANFINTVREIDPYFPSYRQYIEDRRRNGESTTRSQYFYDILLSLPEQARVSLLHRILDNVEAHAPEKVQALRAMLGGAVPGPSVAVNPDAWNADRLNAILREIEESIAASKYERAVTLAYSSLEGFYKAFVRKRVPSAAERTELVELSRHIKKFISTNYEHYPDEVLNMITHVSHAVDRARNRMSESHFEGEAARWLAVYLRDLVNTQIRLLLHFYSD
jgi:hypothetical protein